MRGYYSTNWSSSNKEANNTMGGQTNHWGGHAGSVARKGGQMANLGRHQNYWRSNPSEGRPKTIMDKRWRRKKQNRKNFPKNISVCPDSGNWTVPSSSFTFPPPPHSHINSEFSEAPSRFSEPPPTVVSEPETLDIGTLLSQLQKNGLIGLSQKITRKVPEITLERSHPSLKTRHPEIISQLYGDKPLQCTTCAERFSSEEKTKYGSHLDWHFIKKQSKDAKDIKSRGWYTNSWKDDASDDVTEDLKEVPEEHEKVEEKTVTVGDGEEGSRCPKCLERFELFYSEVEDDKSRNMNSMWTDQLSRDGQWFFKNAVRINKDVYHPQCYREEGSINL